jgi:NSS family neurotransmitter:Na+ symporter
MAAIGSAVGLGNIWRFSYTAYANGGGAFLIPYFTALLVAGIPLMILEYSLGHSQRGSTPLAFFKIRKEWEVVGWWLPMVATIAVLFFYAVVIAWCMDYFVFSFSLDWGKDTGKFFGDYLGATGDPASLGSFNWRVAATTGVVWLVCWAICYREVNHGIEKACLVFMPLLLLLTAVLVAAALRLDGSAAGISMYLKPDFHKIDLFNNPDAWKVWTSAFGQIFFSLSLGFGIMITYASYLPKKTDIVGNAVVTCVANCAYSIFAGFAVFGVLGFMAHSQGVGVEKVAKAGGALAFIVYPKAISSLPFAVPFKNLFGVAFFLALVIAGISSAISLIEALVCALTDKFQISRGGVVTFLCAAGFLGSLTYITGAGSDVMDIVNGYADQALILAGLLECVLVAWIMKASVARKHVNDAGGIHLPKIWEFVVKYVTPAVLLVILYLNVRGVISQFHDGKANIAAHVLYGLRGIAVTILFAWGLTMFKWARKTPHKPEDEHLLT